MQDWFKASKHITAQTLMPTRFFILSAFVEIFGFLGMAR
jgi:hypothetical protein